MYPFKCLNLSKILLMNIKFLISKILKVCRIMLKKKTEYKVSVITILQLPYLSHEPLLEGETKVRSWAHNSQDGRTHCYHSFRGSMPTQLDWVAANTAALVSDIIALRPFHFLKEHPLKRSPQSIYYSDGRIVCQTREHRQNFISFAPPRFISDF